LWSVCFRQYRQYFLMFTLYVEPLIFLDVR
jgi:hypothetical protein